MTKKDHGEPIPGPTAAGPEYVWEADPDMPVSTGLYISRKFLDLIKVPSLWIRENFVLPNKGPKYYWYHRKYERALPVDECYLDDTACLYEANVEFMRNQLVDLETLKILRLRLESCEYWNTTKHGELRTSPNCEELEKTLNREEVNWFIKYGDLHYGASVLNAYNKQKHRLIIERRRALKAQQEGLAEGQNS